MALTMFERLGGKSALTSLVDAYYNKILSHQLTGPYFEGRDMESIKRNQVDMFAKALGSATPYNGKSMKQAHTGLKIPYNHFALVAVMLHDSMREMNIPSDIHIELMDLAISVKSSIVGL